MEQLNTHIVGHLLSPEREDDIKSSFEADHEGFLRYRRLLLPLRVSSISEPIWASVATTPGGIRGVFAFGKMPCAYKASGGHGGCSFCFLSILNMARDKSTILIEHQLQALENALAKTLRYGPSVFEILPDGSFLNPDEVPQDTQTGMMQRLARETAIRKVAIETRPEFCNPSGVALLLDNLRTDQTLEIYFGLETTDPFISEVIHNKGYGFDEFKEAVLSLMGMANIYKNRLEISIYSIIKPGYLTEEEAIESAMQTARDIKAFSDEIGIPISVKFEPAVVSNGTLQGYLYSQERYKPLSYFSVAELIARLHEEGLESTAKFGQRDDIDSFTHVATIPSVDDPVMFGETDAIVYNAVQDFNVDRDFSKFAAKICCVLESREFSNWEMEVYGSANSSLRRVLTGLEEAPAASYWQRKIRCAFSDISALDPNSSDLMGQINTICLGNHLNVIEVRNISRFISSQKEYLQIEVVVIDQENIPKSIWCRIPVTCTSTSALGASSQGTLPVPS